MARDKEGRGYLYPNGRKEKDTHPDYNGRINIDGVEHWISAWDAESKDGVDYLNLSIGDEVQEKGKAGNESEEETDFVDDDIPF